MFGLHRPSKPDINLKPVFDEIWLRDEEEFSRPRSLQTSPSSSASLAQPQQQAQRRPPPLNHTTAVARASTSSNAHFIHANPLDDGPYPSTVVAPQQHHHARQPFDWDASAADLLQQRRKDRSAHPSIDRIDYSPPPRPPIRQADDYWPESTARVDLGVSAKPMPGPRAKPTMTVAQALAGSLLASAPASGTRAGGPVFRPFDPHVDGPEADRWRAASSSPVRDIPPAATVNTRPTALKDLAALNFVVPDAAAASRSASVATSVECRTRVERWMSGDVLSSTTTAPLATVERSAKPVGLSSRLSAPGSVDCATVSDARTVVWDDIDAAERARSALRDAAPPPSTALGGDSPAALQAFGQEASLRGTEFSKTYKYQRKRESVNKDPINPAVAETAATAIRRLKMGLPLPGNEALLGVAFPEIDGDAMLHHEAPKTAVASLRPTSLVSSTAQVINSVVVVDEYGDEWTNGDMAPRLMDLFGRRWDVPTPSTSHPNERRYNINSTNVGHARSSPVRTTPLFTTAGSATDYFASPRRRPVDDRLNFAVFKLL